MTTTPADPEVVARVERLLGGRFRLDQTVAVSQERILFQAWDLLVRRTVSLRVNTGDDPALRRWFLKECEALARLDHPAIRHIYEAGVIDTIAYRVGNWILGESLEEAILRGPRPVPAVHVLARDLLTALEHAHAHGIVVRRIVPASLLLTSTGRGTVTDLRFCNLTLPEIPPTEVPTGLEYLAPEVREGQSGDPASDIYTAAAILYFAVTATRPPLDPTALVPPTKIRAVVPAALERVILRAMLPAPEQRYLTAAEMLEQFTSDAGEFESPQVGLPMLAVPHDDGRHWEARLRRALGDDYELLDTLGEGGFGRVYRVRDLHLEREVALKILHPHLTADVTVVERFRREAQLAARLNHGNIVNIYDISGRSGLLWYTMEIVHGPNIAQLVERDGPLAVDQVLRLLREALSALGHAHALGLVHRDIKPENMLLERDGSLRITDFGLALALRGEGRFGGATSQSGTPQFASPEQLLGEQVDQRTDLYSLSAVACYALLGRVPFPGRTPEQVLAKQTSDIVPDLTEERPDVSEALSAVLGRALRNDVNARWASAGEFRSALEEAVQKALRRRGGELARLAARLLGA
ncbi:MAG TPA: serine/threonine-protein kinase [Gemmatimonadales bacterium]|nr:serine/threonine-protein kinase [Gemmatimonadales bacterium]HRX18308.1 serine/threonine-protein kinase [Gemmatimonadales bacterium]